MIDPDNARDIFQARLPDGEIPSNPRDGFAAMLGFCRDCPVTGGVGDEADGDMVLFQYGTNDWGSGRHFELNLTRQIIFADDTGGEDHEMWQFGLTYRYNPDTTLVALGSYSQWLDDPETDEATVVDAPAVTTAAATFTPSAIEVDWAPV